MPRKRQILRIPGGGAKVHVPGGVLRSYFANVRTFANIVIMTLDFFIFVLLKLILLLCFHSDN